MPAYSVRCAVVGTGSIHVIKRLQEMLGVEGLTDRQAEDIAVRACYVMSQVPDSRPVRFPPAFLYVVRPCLCAPAENATGVVCAHR